MKSETFQNKYEYRNTTLTQYLKYKILHEFNYSKHSKHTITEIYVILNIWNLRLTQTCS